MKESFAGKTIRCRGCKGIFRVEATEDPADASSDTPPIISEDIGDTMADPLPEEQLALVVRPRNIPRPYKHADQPVATFIAVVFGGVCAIPVALTILRLISKERFDRVAVLLPEFIVAWLR